MKNKILISILVLITIACSPLKNVNFDTYLKPSVILPEGTFSILLINRVSNEASKSVYVSTDFLYAGENRDGSNAAIASIKKRFSDNAQYTTIELTAEKSGGFTAMPAPMSEEELAELSRRGGSNVIVSIEYFSASFEKNLIENTGDGSNDGAMYQAALKAEFKAGIRIYSEGKIWKTYEYGEPKTIMSQATTKKEAREKLMKKREFSEDWGRTFGNLFCDQLLPRKVKAIRQVYNDGNQSIKNGVRQLKNKEYEAARKTFEKEVFSADNGIAATALYNLAVIDEMMVSPEKGKETLEKSIAKQKLGNSAKYLNFLNIRIQMRNE